MIEAAEIYSLAETPQRKLVLIDILSRAKQNEALGAVSTLIAVDDDIQSAQGRDKKVAETIISLVHDQLATIESTATAPPSAAPSKQGVKSSPIPTTGGDVSLTIGNTGIADRAKLAAALPNVQDVAGWVFIGDAPKNVDKPGGILDAATAETNGVKIPSEHDSLIACDDLNIRERPFVNGKLGPLLAIVRAGTTMTVTGAPQAHAGSSVLNHKPIEAIWMPVSIPGNPTIADPSKVCTQR